MDGSNDNRITLSAFQPFHAASGSGDGRLVQTSMLPGRRNVWFSCGAASAVAAKLAVDVHGKDVELLYCNTLKNEHGDNMRFLRDVEQWLGVSVKIISSEKYETCEEVWEDRQYMSGPAGAPCTVELKKVPRFAYQWAEDVHIFGLTADEGRRIDRFSHDNHDLFLEWNLRDAGITKADCYEIVKEAGIVLPEMYRLGYENNNCIGCVKATSPHYWNRVRKTHPATFAKRAEQSRRIGCRLVRYKGERIFLDELPPEAAEVVPEDLSCGPQCSPESSHQNQ